MSFMFRDCTKMAFSAQTALNVVWWLDPLGSLSVPPDLLAAVGEELEINEERERGGR